MWAPGRGYRSGAPFFLPVLASDFFRSQRANNCASCSFGEVPIPALVCSVSRT